MTNVKENGAPAPRELEFWGEGKSADIERGFAIVSLRNPGVEPNFDRGEHILAHCVHDKKKVEVVVIANDTKPLDNFYVPILALDGFFSPEHAAEAMRVYPDYENTYPNTPLQAFTFINTSVFNGLLKETQDRLTTSNSIELLRDPGLQKFFLPTMCYWLATYEGGTEAWAGFLEEHNLIFDRENLEKMRNFVYKGSHVFDMLDYNHEALKGLALSPESPLFKPLILAQFD